MIRRFLDATENLSGGDRWKKIQTWQKAVFERIRKAAVDIPSVKSTKNIKNSKYQVFPLWRRNNTKDSC